MKGKLAERWLSANGRYKQAAILSTPRLFRPPFYINVQIAPSRLEIDP